MPVLSSAWIGFDPREAAAFAVARKTLRQHLMQPIPIHGLVLEELKQKGLYSRPMVWKPSAADKPVMWDVISDAPMSTEFANSRFLVPHLAKTGWALFMDCDVLVRSSMSPLFTLLNSSKAVYCVKHHHAPPPGMKMDGQEQTRYARKNWSSFMVFNCDHPSNKKLTVDLVNTLPGRDLHRLCWLEDNEIGELGPEWNYLVRHTNTDVDPKVVHFTDGYPLMPGYESDVYADEWRTQFQRWAL